MSIESILRGVNYAGVEHGLKTLMEGLVEADWRQALIARGFGWHFDVGAFATPIVGGGNGTTFDQDQPEFIVDVPSGFVLVPLRVAVTCKTPLIAADADISEILLAADRTQVLAPTSSTGTVETPTNMRSSTTGACPCTVVSANTSNTTNPVLGIELARAARTGDVQGTPATALWGELSLVYEPRWPMFLVGPAALIGYWGGTVATSGYANVEFLAFPSTLITSLT